MPKRFIRFNLKQNESKKDLFLKDPKADFMVILEKKIFPLHKQLLMKSEFFRDIINQNQNSATINNNIKAEYLQKILGCFYGIEAAFQRHHIYDNILNILALLKITQLQNQLKEDMRVNFDQYGLFGLFYLARKFNLKDVQDKCIKQLIDQQFQQINYNKYDLLQLSPELFTFVLKEHEKLKAKRAITGHDKNHIIAVCEQYCKTTSHKINVQQIVNYGNKYLKQSFFQDQQNIVPVTRKRNATWNSVKREVQNENEARLSKVQSNIHSQTKFNTFEQKSDEVMKIRLINFNMQQKNNLLAEQIREVKDNIGKKDENKQISYGVQELNKKLKQFQEKSKDAHKKMQELRNKILKINNQQDKQKSKSSDEQQQKKVAAQSTSNSLKANKSGVLQSSSKILSQMAILQKSQNIDSDVSDF